MTHTGTTIPVHAGPYTLGAFAACDCGWTGPETTDALAIRDLLDHYSTMKETA